MQSLGRNQHINSVTVSERTAATLKKEKYSIRIIAQALAHLSKRIHLGKKKEKRNEKEIKRIIKQSAMTTLDLKKQLIKGIKN